MVSRGVPCVLGVYVVLDELDSHGSLSLGCVSIRSIYRSTISRSKDTMKSTQRVRARHRMSWMHGLSLQLKRAETARIRCFYMRRDHRQPGSSVTFDPYPPK